MSKKKKKKKKKKIIFTIPGSDFGFNMIKNELNDFSIWTLT